MSMDENKLLQDEEIMEVDLDEAEKMEAQLPENSLLEKEEPIAEKLEENVESTENVVRQESGEEAVETKEAEAHQESVRQRRPARPAAEENPEGEGRVSITSAPRGRRRSLYNGSTIIPVDENSEYVSAEEERHKEYSDLLASANSYNAKLLRNMSIVTDTVVENEYNDDLKMAFVKLYHGHFLVKIPVHLLVNLNNEELDKLSDEERMHYLRRIANAYLGAEIDYMVLALDEEARLAIGNRKRAMYVKRIRKFFVEPRGNNRRIEQGSLVEARVCSVERQNMTIEYGGVEERINVVDVAYHRIADLTQKYRAGDRVAVKIVELERERNSENGTHFVVRSHASIKEAQEDPRKDMIQQMRIGDNAIGTVTMINTKKNCYVQLLGRDIEVLATTSKEFLQQPKKGDRVQVRFSQIDTETLRVFGNVTRII